MLNEKNLAFTNRLRIYHCVSVRLRSYESHAIDINMPTKIKKKCNKKKHTFKSLFIVMKFPTSSQFNPPYLSSEKEFCKYFDSWLLPLDSPIALILHASEHKLKRQRSRCQTNRRIRPKPSMTLSYPTKGQLINTNQ